MFWTLSGNLLLISQVPFVEEDDFVKTKHKKVPPPFGGSASNFDQNHALCFF
jgi:hypothetical protein